MILGPLLTTWVFMGSVLLPSNSDLALQTSRWGSTGWFWARQCDMGLDGFCFAAIEFRSGAPNIPLGLNGMILGPSLATWVLMGVRVNLLKP